ncbi:MAG: hypothetical protein ACP59X_01515 [Solidesulfovibrio sp. DCME]|uniref:hypothetical protein n=1 Tax=Solidesulfovibrio sp. DCME TaxID=3447380 RepID=UPI003D0ABCE5
MMGRKTAALLVAMAALAALALLAFAGVLARPGMVGHTWDWGVPAFAEQFRDMAWRHLSTWDAYFETGRYHYFKLELLYWWLLWPFSTAGGEAVSKGLPLVLTFCAGAALWPLARRQGLPPLFAGLAAIFYAFSPYALSRIVAGHMPMLAGYALLPLVVLSAQVLVERVESRRGGVFYFTVLTGFLLGLTSLHPGVGMSAAAMLTIAFAWRLVAARRKRVLVAAFCGLGLVAVAMNIHFMAPFVGDYFGKGAIRHGWGLSVSAEGDVTVDSELPRREAYHDSTSQPIDATALLRLRPGMDTEYVYPIPEGLGIPWHLAAVLVALGVFAYAFRARKEPELTALFVTAVVGVLLVSGSRTLPGMAFYQLGLKKALPILFAAFSNTTRWLPLVVLPYAILFARAAADLAAAGRPRLVAGASLATVLVFVSPFLAGGLSRPFDPDRDIQPLTLKITPIGAEDGAVYAYLRARRDQFRVAYLPPIGITWPGDTEYTFEWTSAYSPKPFFMAFKTHPLAEPIFAGLYAEHPTTAVARLAALASCRFLVYPHYGHAYTYDDFQPAYAAPAVVDGYKDYKPVFDANLAMQRELVKKPLFTGVDLYENEAFLPLVRPGDRVAAVENVGAAGLANPVVAALAEEVALPGYDPGTVYLRAGHDAVFLEFLSAIMGDGPKKSRLLVDRASDRKLAVERPERRIDAPTVEFRRLGPTLVRLRVHGAGAAFPLVFQETFHAGWKALLVPRRAGELAGDPEGLSHLLEQYAPAPIQAGDAADPAALAGLIARGTVSTLGDGRPKAHGGFVYGPGGAVVGRTETTEAVAYVSRPRAGAVQNDNLPGARLTESFFPGAIAPKDAATLARPLDPAGWRPDGADGQKPVAWPDALHLEAYGFANAWWLDPALLALLPEAGPDRPGYFARRPDGRLDYEVLLSFAPQTSYWIGLGSSAAVFAACLAVLCLGPLFGNRREKPHA